MSAWLGNALLQCGIIMVFCLLGCLPTYASRASGQTFTHFETGIYMFSIIVVLVHLQLAMVLEQWTWLHHFSIWGSVREWPAAPACHASCGGLPAIHPVDCCRLLPAANDLRHALRMQPVSRPAHYHARE